MKVLARLRELLNIFAMRPLLTARGQGRDERAPGRAAVCVRVPGRAVRVRGPGHDVRTRGPGHNKRVRGCGHGHEHVAPAAMYVPVAPAAPPYVFVAPYSGRGQTYYSI